MSNMPYNGLLEFIKLLEAKGQLIRIKEYVNPELEIAEITDRISKSKNQNKALLFENTGTSFPLLINAYGNEERISLALHSLSLSFIENEINVLINKFLNPINSFKEKINILLLLKNLSSYFPYVSKKSAPCQEVVNKNPDLSLLPVLKCWPYDGGKFITLPVVHTKDPITSARNAGMYRMQVFGPAETGMHWHLHKTGARHFNEYLKLKKKVPIAVVLGGDPVYAYCASAPLPDGIDEYILAGFLRKKRVRLVKCLTQDIEVPADADIVIEGYVDPEESLVNEGPFGDHTGFYSLPDNYPKFHVTCITHRKNAVYPATIVGIPPQEDYWMIKASERIFLPLMQKAGLPEVIDMYMPDYGVAHNLVIVQIKNEYPGQAQKVAHSLWGMGQMMLNKVLVITDFDPHNEIVLMERLWKMNNLSKCILFSNGPMDALEHATDRFAFGGKMMIDFTDIQNENSYEFSEEEIKTTLQICNSNEKIKGINDKVLKNKIILISVTRHSDFNDELFIEELDEKNIYPICIIKCDEGLDLFNKKLVIWNCLANIDPVRDIKLLTKNSHTILVLNCISKPNENKHWPNPIYSSKETIQKIDSIWSTLGFEEFESSPSQVIYNLIINEGYETKGNTNNKNL